MPISVRVRWVRLFRRLSGRLGVRLRLRKRARVPHGVLLAPRVLLPTRAALASGALHQRALFFFYIAHTLFYISVSDTFICEPLFDVEKRTQTSSGSNLRYQCQRNVVSFTKS